jgi:hypothetical protein
VEIDPANRSLYLIKADVVETLKTGTTDCSYSVIWDQEVFLPSHEYVLSLCDLRDMEIAFSGLLLKWPEGGEFGPML